ncbi:MAG: TlpA disulfide reductase family protein [Bacteroidia bacterium]|nr:TlpA disulfide reductase family protein [Bacteroidia bacterium]
MKKLSFILILSFFFFGGRLIAQNNATLPSVDVENLLGEAISTSQIANDGNPIVISFWATWCKPCIKELSTIQEVYDDWQEETGVKVIAISVDDARTSLGVRSIVNGRGWDYEVLLDKNSDLKRAMNVVNIPHTFLLNGKREIVYQHTSYAPGDEETLYDKILELKKQEGK